MHLHGVFLLFRVGLNLRLFVKAKIVAGSVERREILEKLAFTRMNKRKMLADTLPGVPIFAAYICRLLFF